ncbi:carbohydrate kinase family protein [Pseudarthrobacter sp. H2]|uniref:carbohydrate kinase family protein n=1 Tax=Pseudarthrobacter sp. H2 TaxID=3418415 RepID=UPI003CE7E07D
MTMLGVVGDLVEDVIVWLGEPVQHGTDSKVEIFHTRGGSGANVAGFAAALHPTRFLGCVGDDHVGRFLVDDLEGKGVDVKVQRRGKSGTIVILIDENGERTMLPQRGASMLLQDVSDDWIDGLDLLHVPAYFFDGGPLQHTSCDLIRRMKKRGGLVSVDASSTGMLQHFGVDPFLDLMAELGPDFIIANQTEAALLQLSSNGVPGDGLARLPHTIVVAKSGPEPTVVHIPGRERLVVPVPPVDCVRDLTGAGDAFAAGFLAGYLQTRQLWEACVTGHATAAKVLSSPGASMAEAA